MELSTDNQHFLDHQEYFYSVYPDKTAELDKFYADWEFSGIMPIMREYGVF